jgi:hypothetical protein
MHVRGRLDHLRKEQERGQILVLFALFLTVLLAMGSIVLDVGNWYVLERHLQTQVDAAALAGGPAFTGCFQDPGATTTAIKEQALRYAGDPSRDASTHNPLMEDTVDVHAVLNSSTYWSDDDEPDGSENDWTMGAPCDAKFLDVKATDDEAPLLWGWIPFFPDLHTRARVEVSQIESTNGLRPLGVPEVDPVQVAVLFVNEDHNINDPDSIRGKSFLDFQSTPPASLEAMSVWSKDNIAPVGINGGENFGVIVVESRSPNPISLNGTLSQICSQNATQTRCYGGTTLTSGISFIHAYSTSGNGSASAPLIRDVTLGGGCPDDLSSPYFNFEGGCSLGISASIDFGTGTDDPSLPVAQGGVCAEVSASPGGPLTWVDGVWTDGAFTPPTASGPQQVNLSWSTDTVGACGGQGGKSGSFNKVAKPYVSNEASGPVQYLRVELSGGGLANSMSKESAASLDVTVGLVPPLRDSALTDPPIVLRGWNTPSQSQALDCANGASGWNDAMLNGCPDAYQPYDEAKHVSTCGPPPSGVPAADPADCISSKNGTFQQNDVIAMLTPCAEHPNRWDGLTKPPDWDKRWMPLFVLDQVAFTQPGKRTYPIRRFGMFYVTAVSGMNCPGDDPNPVSSTKREMWGHFITYITPGLGETIPSIVPCSFGDGGLCVSNLVE